WTLPNRSMSMDPLLLGLVLLAGTLAAGNPLHQGDPRAIKEVKLDMALNSFDDQYLGCSSMMEEELEELNRTEFAKNAIYAQCWTQAAAQWQKKGQGVPLPPGMRTEHAVAIMSYTLQDRLYPNFNANVREGGSSLSQYLHKFDFKVLHFLLTQALSILRKAQPRCYNVYRGVTGIRFMAKPKDLVRFGQFTSSSVKKEVATDFGTDTFFLVNTCYGVPIWDFSYFEKEHEILIPPYEKFEVTSVTHGGQGPIIQLSSQGTLSKYSCEWVKGDILRDG
ncbi:NRT2 ribosyltransferase, partial [Pedionomus torquatus]|nr:NRT2 ribosyltransferase [Pedionomus torquatus]